MIPNVVLGRARASADDVAIEAGLPGIGALRLPSQASVAVGRDVGLRAAGWTFAITNDWVDGEAYHRYDIDPEHNVYRDRIAAQCEEIARVPSRSSDRTTHWLSLTILRVPPAAWGAVTRREEVLVPAASPRARS